MKKVLFVCSENKLRSPTPEKVFSERKYLEVRMKKDLSEQDEKDLLNVKFK